MESKDEIEKKQAVLPPDDNKHLMPKTRESRKLVFDVMLSGVFPNEY